MNEKLQAGCKPPCIAQIISSCIALLVGLSGCGPIPDLRFIENPNVVVEELVTDGYHSLSPDFRLAVAVVADKNTMVTNIATTPADTEQVARQKMFLRGLDQQLASRSTGLIHYVPFDQLKLPQSNASQGFAEGFMEENRLDGVLWFVSDSIFDEVSASRVQYTVNMMFKNKGDTVISNIYVSYSDVWSARQKTTAPRWEPGTDNQQVFVPGLTIDRQAYFNEFARIFVNHWNRYVRKGITTAEGLRNGSTVYKGQLRYNDREAYDLFRGLYPPLVPDNSTPPNSILFPNGNRPKPVIPKTQNASQQTKGSTKDLDQSNRDQAQTSRN